MTELKIDKVGNRYTVHYSAEGVDFQSAQEIIELITGVYERQGSFSGDDDFIVSKITFYGHFKVRGD